MKLFKRKPKEPKEDKLFAEPKARGEKTLIITEKALDSLAQMNVELLRARGKRYGYQLINLTMNPSSQLGYPCQQIVATFQLTGNKTSHKQKQQTQETFEERIKRLRREGILTT